MVKVIIKDTKHTSTKNLIETHFKKVNAKAYKIITQETTPRVKDSPYHEYFLGHDWTIKLEENNLFLIHGDLCSVINLKNEKPIKIKSIGLIKPDKPTEEEIFIMHLESIINNLKYGDWKIIDAKINESHNHDASDVIITHIDYDIKLSIKPNMGA